MDVETSSFDVGTYAFGSGAESIHTYGLIALCQDDGAILEPWRHHDSCPGWPHHDSKQCQMSYHNPSTELFCTGVCQPPTQLHLMSKTERNDHHLPTITTFVFSHPLFCLRLVFTSLKTLVLLVMLVALRVRGYTFCSNWFCSSFWECSRCIIPWTSNLTVHAPWEIQCIGHVYFWCGFKRATWILYLIYRYTYHASPWSQSLQKWTSWHKMP